MGKLDWLLKDLFYTSLYMSTHEMAKSPVAVAVFGGHQINCQSSFKSSGVGLTFYLSVDNALC